LACIFSLSVAVFGVYGEEIERIVDEEFFREVVEGDSVM
jgi:hypothetical protein